MFEKIDKQEDFIQRQETSYTGRWISRVRHPYTCRISRKTVHWSIMNKMKEMLMTDSRSL